MKIKYNAPVTLTFALISAFILAFDQFAQTQLVYTLFSVPGRGHFSANSFIDYVRLFTHIIGHQNWSHLMSNFAFILLLGPILEEKYGTFNIFIMLFITAGITGLLNVLFFQTGLMGASGIVFMMILLVSFANIQEKEIPLTFILIVILYLAREFINSFQTNTISEFAHIAGGVCGSLFGFLKPKKH